MDRGFPLCPLLIQQGSPTLQGLVVHLEGEEEWAAGEMGEGLWDTLAWVTADVHPRSNRSAKVCTGEELFESSEIRFSLARETSALKMLLEIVLKFSNFKRNKKGVKASEKKKKKATISAGTSPQFWGSLRWKLTQRHSVFCKPRFTCCYFEMQHEILEALLLSSSIPPWSAPGMRDHRVMLTIDRGNSQAIPTKGKKALKCVKDVFSSVFFSQLHSQFGCLLRPFLNTLQTLLLEAGNS